VLPFWRCLGEKKRGTHLRLCKTKECDCRVCSNRSRIQHHSSQKWRQFHLFAEGSVLLESLQASGVQKQRRHGSKPIHVLTACAKLLCSSSMCKHVVCNPGVLSMDHLFIFLYPAVSDLQASGPSSALPHSNSIVFQIRATGWHWTNTFQWRYWRKWRYVKSQDCRYIPCP
jgi:hypothetical protein